MPNMDPNGLGTNPGTDPTDGTPVGTVDTSGGDMTPPGSNTSGGTGLMGWLDQNIGGPLGITNPGAAGSIMPSLATALQLYNSAGQYNQLGQQASQMANPFGDRSQYVKMLSDLEKDPSQIANTPGYKFNLDQTLNAVRAKEAAAGYGGTSTEQNAMETEASGLAAKTYNDTIAQLSNLAGAQFNPASAGSLLMEGGNNANLARIAAVNAMMAPFLRQAGVNSTVNNNTSAAPQNQGSGGGGGGGGGSPINFQTGGGSQSGLIGVGNFDQNGNYIGPAPDPSLGLYDPTTGTYTSDLGFGNGTPPDYTDPFGDNSPMPSDPFNLGLTGATDGFDLSNMSASDFNSMFGGP